MAKIAETIPAFGAEMHLHAARHFRTNSPRPSARVEHLESRVLFSGAAAATPEQLVADANNAFAFDMLHQLTQSNSGNLFFSPYSAATALEMALQGAQGTTATQIIQALHLPSSQIATAGIQALYQLFQSAPAGGGSTLSTANRLWVNSHVPLLSSFLSDSNAIFGADAQPVDFSNPEAAANTINSWVSDQTHGKITNLIPASDLNQFTILVLTNAIYFHGDWADPFNPDATQSQPFQMSSTQAATVSMMEQGGSEFSYYAQSGPNGFQAVRLPYEGSGGDPLDMLVILPTTYDLGSFESSLTPTVFSTINSNLASAYVDLQLPKFQLAEGYDLVQPLEALGITSAFTPSADFSGMSNTPSMISFVVQKSFIDVDETGTTAAAATGIGVTTGVVAAPPPLPTVSFDADHPFVFAITDQATSTILFLGSVTDPSNGATDYATAATPLPALPEKDFPQLASPAPTSPISGGTSVTDPAPVGSSQTPGGTSTPPPTAVASPVVYPISATVRQTFTATLATTSLPSLPGGGVRGVTIRWGDGSHSAGTLTPDGDAFAITGRHRYRARRQFKVNITVWQKLHGKYRKPSVLTRLVTTAAIL